jgi:streptogramin lyase
MAGEHPLQIFKQALRVMGHAALILSALLLGGCLEDSPSDLHSQLFDEVEVIGGRGSALGQFNKPRSVAVDREDNLYVVDLTGRVQKFSPAGEFIKSWQLPQTDLGKPKGMSLDPKGNIVVVEPHYQRVNHFTPDGELVQQWGRKGTNLGELILPRSIAINSRGETFLSEYTTVDRVQGFTADAHRPFLLFGQPGDARIRRIIFSSPTHAIIACRSSGATASGSRRSDAPVAEPAR